MDALDVGGLESLAGGRTGGHPYSGPDGEKRFAKMKENVVKEWEEEQRKKKAADEAAAAAAVQEGAKVKTEAGASESRLERLKANTFGRYSDVCTGTKDIVDQVGFNTDTSNILLTLSLEIRSSIYKFTFSSIEPLCYFYDDVSSNRRSFSYRYRQPDPNMPKEFNKFKVVDQQLFSETASLELRYSVLVFDMRSKTVIPQGAQAVKFWLCVSAKKRDWFSRITIDAAGVSEDC